MVGSPCYLRCNENKRKCLAFFDGLHSCVSGLHPSICESIFPSSLSLVPNGSILSWFAFICDGSSMTKWSGDELVSDDGLSTFLTKLVGRQVHPDWDSTVSMKFKICFNEIHLQVNSD